MIVFAAPAVRTPVSMSHVVEAMKLVGCSGKLGDPGDPSRCFRAIVVFPRSSIEVCLNVLSLGVSRRCCREKLKEDE